MNQDPEADVVEASLALLGADEEVERLHKAWMAAREHSKWARVNLSASTLALRAHRLADHHKPEKRRLPPMRG